MRGIATPPYMDGMHSAAPPAILPIAATVDDPSASVPQRYLALLADVAERLLAADRSAAMVDDLFDLIRRELRLDVFFNYRLDGDRLILEAHGGLSEAEARDGAVLTVGQAVCGCVARDRKPIHAIGVQSSDDPLHAFVKAMGLDAYACTPLLHGDQMLGTLGFGRRWSDRFTADEIRFLHTICHYVALAKYRLRTEAELRDGVAERERLLAELNHRVRNALQVAVGLVVVELRHADVDAQSPLRRAVDRLQVLALAHRPLYASGTPDAIDVGGLLTGLIESEADGVTIGSVVQAGSVPVETAAALALLVHILLAAADGAVVVGAVRSGDRLQLSLGGLTTTTPAAPTDARMIASLLRQLRGEVVIDSGGSLIILSCTAHD